MDLLATKTLASTNDQIGVHDLLALSDEQILEIAPESEIARQRDAERPAEPAAAATSDNAARASSVTSHDSAEPPAWLAAQMRDAWGGEEAREFWNGVQQARSEAAVYRAAIASPEDARALKELYPGGLNEARAAAERARLLDEVDQAYFGAVGNSPEQLSASRAQLAQRMLREDPAAFREMVEAGIKVLQQAAGSQSEGAKTLASTVLDASGNTSPVGKDASFVVAQHAVPLQGNQDAARAGAQDHEHVAAYAAFERAANEDLERSVGGAIERTLAQALPSFEQHNAQGQGGAQLYPERSRVNAGPLRDRLAGSVRVEVEKALQGDRQLGEQVAQILSSRRFDNESRAQIVRLIGDRAQQLVPGAAKRVLNEWTQTTLSAHRARTQRDDSASTDVAPVYPEVHGRASLPARPIGNEQHSAPRQNASRDSGQGAAARSRQLNYRKLSDEQILDL